MAQVKPFAALRPKPELAAKICAPPYDVLSSEEARALAQDNPLSFLHVSKPEIDLPPGTDPYAPAVYAQGKSNLQRLMTEGALYQEAQPCFYLYRQTMGAHSQIGIVATASCHEYLNDIIKKHEFTRPDKEDDRVRHIEALNSQTGPVFLVYQQRNSLSQFLSHASDQVPDVDFLAEDGVRHTAWTLADPDSIHFIENEFSQISALYIADGHHRSAAAARVSQSRHGQGAAAFFLAVLFPHTQMQILPYNRVIKDLNGMTPPQLLQALEKVCTVQPASTPQPSQLHQVFLLLQDRWHKLQFHPHLLNSDDPLDRLDVNLLQKHILKPLFAIDDPRTSQRIQFVGGIRGTAELEKLVASRQFECAFAMHPTSINDLMAVSDRGGVMPPKSTWFEPKLRDAMFCHML